MSNTTALALMHTYYDTTIGSQIYTHMTQFFSRNVMAQSYSSFGLLVFSQPIKENIWGIFEIPGRPNFTKTERVHVYIEISHLFTSNSMECCFFIWVANFQAAPKLGGIRCIFAMCSFDFVEMMIWIWDPCMPIFWRIIVCHRMWDIVPLSHWRIPLVSEISVGECLMGKDMPH